MSDRRDDLRRVLADEGDERPIHEYSVEWLRARVAELEAELRSERNNPTFARCHVCCELMLSDDVESQCVEPCRAVLAPDDGGE